MKFSFYIGLIWLLVLQVWASPPTPSNTFEKVRARHPDTRWQPLVEGWEQARQAAQTPGEHLTLPLEYHANQRAKVRLKAAKVQMLDDGLIYAETVVIEMLTEQGEIEGKMIAEDCLYQRKTKLGYCRGAVEVEGEGDKLKGRGMYFSTEDKFVKILAKCEIRTKRMKNNFGRL